MFKLFRKKPPKDDVDEQKEIFQLIKFGESFRKLKHNKEFGELCKFLENEWAKNLRKVIETRNIEEQQMYIENARHCEYVLRIVDRVIDDAEKASTQLKEIGG